MLRADLVPPDGRARAAPGGRQPQVADAIALLGERFSDAGQDGPSAYTSFLATVGDDDERAMLYREAVATVHAFLEGFREEETPASSSRLRGRIRRASS